MKNKKITNSVFEKLNISEEMKELYQNYYDLAEGDWVVFLTKLMEFLVEEERYEKAVLIRDALPLIKDYLERNPE